MSAAALPRHVALYLAVVQFFFALGWTVYVLFLPELLQRAGIARAWLPWVLALDQAIFAVADLAMGVAMDRARRALRRVGGWLLALVGLSSLAMLGLPFVSQAGAIPFLIVTVVWVASSAALRAPPFALLSRYAATADMPWLAGLMMVGLAAAAALAPYLGLQLAAADPRWPFTLASVAIFTSALGLVVAERRLAEAPSATASEAGTPLPFASPAALLLVGALIFAVLGFQIQVAINAAAQIRRVADAAALPWLLPVFWAGFAFGFLPAKRLGQRLGKAPAAALACCIGALALLVAAQATLPAVLIVAHALAGATWALFIANAFGIATAAGRSGAEGRYTGLIFALMALGTLVRIALSLAGVPQRLQAGTDWLAVAAWGGAAVLLFRLARRV